MSQWSWKESHWKDSWIEPWQWKEQDKWLDDDEELFFKLVFEERNPWPPPTESCASDETEEEEEVKRSRAPPDLSKSHQGRSEDSIFEA